MTYFEQNKTYQQNGSIHSVLFVTAAVFIAKAANVIDSIAWRLMYGVGIPDSFPSRQCHWQTEEKESKT